MAERLNRIQLAQRAEVVSAPIQRACDDRTFELPVALHVATALMFFGFVSVLNLAFRTPAMLMPFGIFVMFIAAFFTVPAFWVRMWPKENDSRALEWREFMRNGIATPTGRASGHDATVLVLLLPLLIFCWALAVATIALLA